MRAVGDWERAGERLALAGWDIFVLDRPAERERAEPVLILHGFPTCSFDWRAVVPALGRERRVVALDFLGFGLSAKPFDHAYSLFEQADVVAACAKALGLEEVALVSHDMGDSVGGELLARSLDGALPFGVARRVLVNGSVYIGMAHLSAGQQMLLALPDEPIPPEAAPAEDLFKASLAATFAPDTQPSPEELDAQWALLSRGEGHRLLARTIRYVEERRAHEGRWTGAIRDHPSPLTVIWGDADPIAVFAMAERLCRERPDAPLVRLAGIGHYPMIEAPGRFAEATLAGLGGGSPAPGR